MHYGNDKSMKETFFLGLSRSGFHRVAYTEWGAADNPRVLICVHGLSRNGRDFDALAEALSPDYRVICPDMVGRGKSGWLANKADYGNPQYIADMAALIARSGVEQVDWVGTSMGGIIGMLLAAMPGSPIRKMLINDVGALIPKAALERIALYIGKDQMFESYDAFKHYIKTISASFGLYTEEQWDHIARSTVKFEPGGKVHCNYDPGIGAAFRGGALADVDLSVYWQAIRCPVLVTRGTLSDLLLPDTYAAMLKKPGVKGVEIAGVGHAPMFMDEAQIRIARDFLLSD
jgi:pimeloyl-ACP methyl ester carboxylesterase